MSLAPDIAWEVSQNTDDYDDDDDDDVMIMPID